MLVALAAGIEHWAEAQGSILVVYNVSTPLTHSSTNLFVRSTSEQAKVLKVWAHPDSLATTTGIVVYFLFLRVLRCFSSPGSLQSTYVFS